ncbi:acyl-CoA dehydrogenase family protein [Actinopolymorpha pittospori]|uniref:Glutaryl-CoA dehydrogenase n=1 Tax=Actinopolymorpha pittospori TaxID=648752 RepID=A0A927N0T6_9ACTN|nr:acyl-CoA dehydrogenase family protein [Actinopolymorpha pittospori]MBE1609697.1 glutaryl-CoA dehydrogenase [Actinopolymorpha pittospori]
MSRASRSTGPLDPSDLLDASALLSDEERAIQDTVRRTVREHAEPHVGTWFEQAEFPTALVPRFAKLGLLGMHLTGYGCAGTNAVSYGLACLELEAVDSALRSFVSVQGSLAMFALWRFGSEAQKQEWLPRMAAGEAIGCFGLTEPDHGSDPSAMATTARRTSGGWVLNGTKMWITNGGIADVAVVWARTDEGVRGFCVPRGTAGFTTRDIRHKLSLRASVTSELVFEDCELPADAQLPEATGLRAPLACLNEARFGIVWGALGAARTCFETALRYAREREQFGRPIGAFQLTQHKLVDMALELNKGLLLALHLGRRKDAGELRPDQVSFGKLNNVRVALDIAREARTILGANGISLEYPVLRHANNLESVLTYEGTTEVHTLVLGEAITGLSAFR